MSAAKNIFEELKRQVRDDLFRVHEVCPRCVVNAGDSTRTGCPVVDEYMVERIINTCAVGVRAMESAANASERINMGLGQTAAPLQTMWRPQE